MLIMMKVRQSNRRKLNEVYIKNIFPFNLKLSNQTC
jgi:hypothetical protein